MKSVKVNKDNWCLRMDSDFDAQSMHSRGDGLLSLYMMGSQPFFHEGDQVYAKIGTYKKVPGKRVPGKLEVGKSYSNGGSYFVEILADDMLGMLKFLGVLTIPGEGKSHHIFTKDGVSDDGFIRLVIPDEVTPDTIELVLEPGVTIDE